MKDEVEPVVEMYWPIRHEVTMIEGIVNKGK